MHTKPRPLIIDSNGAEVHFNVEVPECSAQLKCKPERFATKQQNAGLFSSHVTSLSGFNFTAVSLLLNVLRDLGSRSCLELKALSSEAAEINR